MTGSTFMLSLTVLLTIFLMRKKITIYINDNYNLKCKIQSEWIVYLLFIIFVFIMALGMLLDQGAEGKVSVGFSSMQPTVQKKPNPLFDINFEVFNF